MKTPESSCATPGRRSRLKRLTVLSLKVLIAALVPLLLLEITLRIVPSLVPPAVLIHFEPRVRKEIARGRLPTKSETVNFERTDGGFPFTLWKPFAQIHYDFDDPGTVKVVTMDELGFCNCAGKYPPSARLDV